MIGVAVVCVAIAIGFTQGWSLAKELQRASFSDVGLIPAGTKVASVIALSCATAALVLGVVAGAISEYGLGNGFVALLAAQTIATIARAVIAAPPHAAAAVVAVLLVAVVATATAWLVRKRFGAVDGTRVGAPAGLIPLLWVVAAWSIINAASAIGVAPPHELLDWMVTRGIAADVIVVIALTAGIAWLAARPAQIAALYGRMTATAVAADRRAWAWAGGANTVVLIGLFAVAAGVTPVLDVGVWTSIGIAITTVAVLDVVADWRARRRADLVGVWPIHDAALADTAAAVLARSGIPAHLRGRHARMLFNLFGPFVPIEVMVPADRAGEASALLKDMFDPAARGVTTAW